MLRNLFNKILNADADEIISTAISVAIFIVGLSIYGVIIILGIKTI